MSDASPLWDPCQYNRFEAQRDRAALDLLVRLPEDFAPAEIWDLGCGTGQHAALLKRRHPHAAVHGLDASAAMLYQARALSTDVDWSLGDIATWTPERPADLILANASLQWLPDHAALFAHLAGALAPGGLLAVQMPMAWETRHHTIMRETAAQGPWASVLSGVGTIAPLLPAEAYYEALAPLCDDIDLWSTTYLHVLAGDNAVLEWMKGTALRPYLTALAGDPALRDAFLIALSAPLSAAFPRRQDGATLLPFPRLFLVAQRR
ncbi:MAG: methyltransferase domain-containing protein [Candidatus Brevundimonas phytovorans]|nr:methyltransferase domain-containing protein [Brevundimonas sp.]WEK58673.1 MAG: methyltransferase domain-containing protein [Brevundimonas sp.]